MGIDLELCLDFTDVVDWRNNASRRADRLGTYTGLLEWSRKHGILNRQQEDVLRAISADESARVMADAVRLRESTYRIFSAVAHKRKADPYDLGVLNEYLARGLSKVRVSERRKKYDWDWSGDVSADMMLYPIASSAAGLLTSDSLDRVRECANEKEGCGSLFLDYSKSQTRRWCSMDSCGNRMKFRAYYERQHHPKVRPSEAKPRAA